MKQPEGYLLVDHRASPGLSEDAARRFGYEPSLVAEGKVLEAAVLMCAHCRAPYVKNPLRTRERASCHECGVLYICDNCDFERRQPGYVHMPMNKIVDLVASGKATVVTLGSRPLLVPAKSKEI